MILQQYYLPRPFDQTRKSLFYWKLAALPLFFFTSRLGVIRGIFLPVGYMLFLDIVCSNPIRYYFTLKDVMVRSRMRSSSMIESASNYSQNVTQQVKQSYKKLAEKIRQVKDDTQKLKKFKEFTQRIKQKGIQITEQVKQGTINKLQTLRQLYKQRQDRKNNSVSDSQTSSKIQHEKQDVIKNKVPIQSGYQQSIQNVQKISGQERKLGDSMSPDLINSKKPGSMPNFRQKLEMMRQAALFQLFSTKQKLQTQIPLKEPTLKEDADGNLPLKKILLQDTICLTLGSIFCNLLIRKIFIKRSSFPTKRSGLPRKRK